MNPKTHYRHTGLDPVSTSLMRITWIPCLGTGRRTGFYAKKWGFWIQVKE
ncbi:MAG: hypothetical protein NTZ13_01535 [Candidatus Parcubacteria bacterium]|nr:hypothetical protein [Candidatus Parcubacteria bacterium]